MSQFCRRDGCTAGFHAVEHDAGDDCVGCLPRLVVPGLLLCARHADAIGRDALDAAALHHDLLLSMAGGGSALGDVVKGSKNYGLSLSDAHVAARDTIQRVLASWVDLIVSESTSVLCVMHGGPGWVQWMAGLIVRNSEWLASHDAAGDASAELDELAHGEAYRLAHPSGSRSLPIDDMSCPECGGALRAILRRPDALHPARIVCDAERPHAWTQAQWEALRAPGDQWVTDDVFAAALGYETSSVRSLVKRGTIGRNADGLVNLTDARRLRQKWESEAAA